MLKARVKKHSLQFKIPGGTSRGVLKTKDSWFLFIWDDENPAVQGVGECSIIPKLSPDNWEIFDNFLPDLMNNIHFNREWENDELLVNPSIQFGLETAFLDLKNGGSRILFPSGFTEGKSSIPINGLIWMGAYDFMRKQILEKIEAGFRCIKLKIGAINFDEELQLLKLVRNDFNERELEIRVDANGAFKPDEALEKLNRLAEWDIHSIEQPIRQGQWKKMAELCRDTPIPIALDEELIGIFQQQKTEKLLSVINPQYIILKPSLLGGLKASLKWITAAEEKGIGWWVTSALESNVGLNAIAQWTASLKNPMPQGLGTGQLFTNNISSPLFIQNARLYFNSENNWDFNMLA